VLLFPSFPLFVRDPLVATIMNNLGLAYKSVGALQDAEQYYLSAIDVRSKVLGDDHPETIVSKHNLSGRCYFAC
jgi:hypothetical protein